MQGAPHPSIQCELRAKTGSICRLGRPFLQCYACLLYNVFECQLGCWQSVSMTMFNKTVGLLVIGGVLVGGGVWLWQSRVLPESHTAIPPNTTDATTLGGRLPSDYLTTTTPVDAALLNGHDGLYYLNAANMTGTISPAIFSAYDSLVFENKIPDSSTIATQADLDAAIAAQNVLIQSKLRQLDVATTSGPAVSAGLGLASSGSDTVRLDVVTGEGIIIKNNKITAILGNNIDLLSEVAGVLSIAHGGTGLSSAPGDGQFLVGSGSGYTFANLVGGQGVELTRTGDNFEIKVNDEVCLISGNCSGVGSGIVGAGVTDQLAFFSNSQTISSSSALSWSSESSQLSIDGNISIAGQYLVDGQPMTADLLGNGLTNRYYSSALFNADWDTKTTSDLPEGSGLYWTNARFDSHLASKTTSDVSEGSRLYYTDARVSDNQDVSDNTAARHSAATVADSATLNLSIVSQHITGSVIQSGLQTSLLTNDAGFIATLVGFDTELSESK